MPAEPNKINQKYIQAGGSVIGQQVNHYHSAPYERPTPHMVPSAPDALVGRDHAIDVFNSSLKAYRQNPSKAPLVAVDGMAGVGKTALVNYWSHSASNEFPDGQLYADLRGFDPASPPADPEFVLHQFLAALGVPPEQAPRDLDGKISFYRSILAGRRLLIVLDNARDAEHARPLLPGTGPAMTLVTSRSSLREMSSFDYASHVNLSPLIEDESEQLVRRHLDPQSKLHDETINEIVEICAGLPLAIVVAAHQFVRSSYSSAEETIREIGADLRGNKEVDTEDTSSRVQAVFYSSYRSLPAEAQRLFRLLSLHPGTEFDRYSVSCLAALPQARARKILSKLLDAHLLSKPTPGRFSMHDLVRAFSLRLSIELDTDAERQASWRRLLSHTVHTAHSAEALVNPVWRVTNILPRKEAGVILHPLPNRDRAWEWLEANHSSMVLQLNEAYQNREDTHASFLSWVLDPYQTRQGYCFDNLKTLRCGSSAAKRSNAKGIQAILLSRTVETLAQLGETPEAKKLANELLGLANGIGHNDLIGKSHDCLATVYLHEQDFDLAGRHASEAAKCYEREGNHVLEAGAYTSLGWIQAQSGRYKEAILSSNKSIRLAPEPEQKFRALDTIAYSLVELGHIDEAIANYKTAYSLALNANENTDAAEVLNHLGDAYKRCGDAAQAEESWHKALSLHRDTNHPKARDIRDKLERMVS